MGKLSTHVLDISQGKPAQGIFIELFRIQDEQRYILTQAHSNKDGRCEQPLLENEALTQGIYELVFHAGAYFSELGIVLEKPSFVDRIALQFGIARPDENYHVPLLVSPWSWSTYRGS